MLHIFLKLRWTNENRQTDFFSSYDGILRFSTVTLESTVGGTPETREVNGKNGQPQTVTTMSVAINNHRNRDAEPVWYRVTMWNGLGTTVEQYVDKGSYVVVTGDRLTVSTWIDQDGNARATLELTANAVDFSANKRGNGDDENAPVDEQDMPF